MLRYIIWKFFYSFLVMLGIATVIFLIFNIEKLNPARSMLGQMQSGEMVEAINKDLGWNLPKWKRYLVYLNDLSPLSLHHPGNQESAIFLDPQKYRNYTELTGIGEKVLLLKTPYLRRSYQSQRRVTAILGEAFPSTALLAVVSILIATIIGITLGISSAVWKNTLLDKVNIVVSIFGMSVPSFVAAILMMWIFAYLLGHITGLPVTGSLYEIDEFDGRQVVLKNLILPAITLGVRPLAIVTQLTRSSMLEVLSQDYVRTATAKGLSFYSVLLKHSLINALNPVVTAISGWFASLMAGAVFVEIVFGWRGIGRILLDALNTYDLPVVMGAVILISVIFVIVNLLVDIIYGILDPRVRVS